MSKILFCLFFVLSLEFVFANSPYYSKCQQAFRACDWNFAGGPAYKLRYFALGGKPDVAFTSRIVAKNRRIILGVLNMNGFVPEFIDERYGAIPITSFANPRYTPTHFKPYSIPYSFGSGVGYQTFTGDQRKVARYKCIRVRFSAYQQLFGTKYPYVKYNFNDVSAEANKCVVFRIAY